MSKTILVTGANGQLGSELQDLAILYPQFQFVFYGSDALDLSSEQSIKSAFQKNSVDYVINCGAYTKVDHAEDYVERAYEINAQGLLPLIHECNHQNAVLIHLSSDYVYDSVSDRPILETDPTQPKGVYAKSKLKGEQFIEEKCDSWLIIRTSWVYSTFGHNFVKTMIRLGREREELNIVNDQKGTPTFAKDIAKTILEFVIKIEQSKDRTVLLNEIYNFSNTGNTTWDAFARKIFDLSGIDCKVNGITTAAYGAKAPRPLWSILSKEKIQNHLGIQIRSWEVALKECLDSLDVLV